MLVASLIVQKVRASYVVAIMAILGVFAFVTAVLISWPALAYMAAKLFV